MTGVLIVAALIIAGVALLVSLLVYSRTNTMAKRTDSQSGQIRYLHKDINGVRASLSEVDGKVATILRVARAGVEKRALKRAKYSKGDVVNFKKGFFKEPGWGVINSVNPVLDPANLNLTGNGVEYVVCDIGDDTNITIQEDQIIKRSEFGYAATCKLPDGCWTSLLRAVTNLPKEFKDYTTPEYHKAMAEIWEYYMKYHKTK